MPRRRQPARGVGSQSGSATPVHFAEFFETSQQIVRRYGAFNISLVADLPLFIDPFLLFNSRKSRYRRLHDEIIRYLVFLRDRSKTTSLSPGLIDSWYRFPEVKQTWLGFTAESNRGRGLGPKFARALNQSLGRLFSDFGEEGITRGSHLEKLCLVRDGVGRDSISDFTTNLIVAYLAQFTETFAKRHVPRRLRGRFWIEKARFNYQTETWQREQFDLPRLVNDYVLLVPRDILTKDDTWINKSDLIDEFDQIPDAIPDEQLRAQVNNYFVKVLGVDPGREEHRKAALETIHQFPALIDYYIRYKEEHGDRAESISADKVEASAQFFVRQAQDLRRLLGRETGFYDLAGSTHEEARERILFLKDVVENKGGHRLFYVRGQPVEREEDLQILYRLTWYRSPLDVSREVNDGRGPADYKVSRGAGDKTIVEFKLASNRHLKRNLAKQAELYQAASDAGRALKVILYFSDSQYEKVRRILKELNIEADPNVIIIDAGRENKPSASRA